MMKLVNLFDQRYGKLVLGIPKITVGEYELKKYFIFDNEKSVKILYLDTIQGMYKTASKPMIRSLMFGGIGKLLQEQFDKGETVLVEIINQRKLSGKFGLAFRLI